MRVLGIECSASAASAAVVEDGKLLGEFFVNTKQTHSQTLLPMIEALLGNLGLACRDLDGIAVANGPGSFTGVRIGVACAKGLALPGNTPCRGVSTLEAIAFGGLACKGSLLCAVMDARCGQVYNALFETDGNTLARLTEDRALSIQALGEECRPYGDRVLLLGDGAALCHQSFSGWGARLAPENLRFQRAGSVALLAMGRAWTDPAGLLPVYLRMPQAERELKRKLENHGSPLVKSTT